MGQPEIRTIVGEIPLEFHPMKQSKALGYLETPQHPILLAPRQDQALPKLPHLEPTVTASLIASEGDYLLQQLAEQVQHLNWLFTEYSGRALGIRETKASAAALGVAIKAQQASVRTMIGIAGLLAHRQRPHQVELEALPYDDIE